MKGPYESKATTLTIRATSRASMKIKDNFYTVEYCEERSVPEDCDIDEERKILWNTCNVEVDTQIEDIINTFKRK